MLSPTDVTFILTELSSEGEGNAPTNSMGQGLGGLAQWGL